MDIMERFLGLDGGVGGEGQFPFHTAWGESQVRGSPVCGFTEFHRNGSGMSASG
jgi:hypothetical protein